MMKSHEQPSGRGEDKPRDPDEWRSGVVWVVLFVFPQRWELHCVFEPPFINLKLQAFVNV